MIDISNLFLIFKYYCRPPYLYVDAVMMRLLGATIVLMHETIRIMNMYR